MAKYRIVRDNFLGYEVQWRHWWFPFWIGRSNTHATIESAEAWARDHARGAVKYLGDLSSHERPQQ